MTSLALTAQPSTASVLLQITDVPTLRTNLVVNPSFETNTTSWSAVRGTLARTVAAAPAGGAYLTYTSTDGSVAEGNQAFTAFMPVTAGKVYTGSLSVKAFTAAPKYKVVLNWYNASSVFVSGSSFTTADNVPTSAFVRIAVTATAPATATQVRLLVVPVSALAVGAGFHVDAAMLEQVDQLLGYFDGSSPGASWSSTAHGSTSTMPVSGVTITRSDANGVAPVRLRTGQVPIGGAMTVTDYEPSLDGLIRYDVVDGAGAQYTASTTLDGLVAGSRIVGVQEPQLTVSPELITGYESSRESGSAVLRILQRADPVVLLAPTRTREGVLEVWCRTYVDAHLAELVLAESRILLLRQSTHPGMDMYFLASSASVRPLQHTRDGWRWQVTARYIEVRNPNLPLLGGAGWTFDDLVTLYPTFGTVRSEYATFSALTVGP